jgi:hypothetical protein
MTSRSCKLGFVLPVGLHEQMAALAGGSATGTTPRGAIQLVYAQAFIALLEDLDARQPVVFAPVRGAKARAPQRLPEALCARIRAQLEPLNLKLADFACAAVQRTLSPHDGG